MSRVKRSCSHPTVASEAVGCCAVCQEGMATADAAPGTLLQLPCGHTFHAGCISSCSEQLASSCPLCRKRYSRRSLRR